jgi:hypothetical protein
LARAGLSGPPDAIEGSQGFGRAVSDTFDGKKVIDRLGTEWVVASEIIPSDPNLAIKEFRSAMASLRPGFEADRWLAKMSNLDTLDRASEVIIR